MSRIISILPDTDGSAIKLLMVLTEIVGVDTLPVIKPDILPPVMVFATIFVVEMVLVTI